VEAAEAGLDVVVLEDRYLGAGATGLSTAKVTVLHGLRYSSLRRRHGVEVAARYAAAQTAGLDWLRERAGSVLERATAFTYAAPSSEEDADVRAEVSAAVDAGIDARYVSSLDVPFPAAGAVAVDDQHQVDPGELLRLLADRLAAHGGRIIEGCRVLGVGHGPRVRTALGAIAAGHVVVATGLPFLDRTLLFARTEPQTSYCIGVRTSDARPDGMYLSAASGRATRSVRTAPDPERPGERVLVVGGAGHKTGAAGSTAERYLELESWARQHWAVDAVPWRWSTEDFVPDDGLPFVGPSPFSKGVLVATGYAKWGFTNAAAAAVVLAASLVDDRSLPAWAGDWDPRRIELRRGGSELVKANADVARKLVGGWVGQLVRRDVRRSRVCTHLGGIVRWNDGDECWDCPLHGSKFSAQGSLRHGPATKDLAGD
jgi:glycine/D-amino acid oxidase-like deaminating enzyme